MDAMLQPPAATALDAVASIVSLAVYLGVALAALARSPHSPAARVFLIIALASAVPYMLPPLQWWKGDGVYTPAMIALTAAAFSVGAAALFHFTQIFPWRRPWIRAYGRWLIAAYVLPALPIAVVAWLLGNLMTQLQAASGGLGAVSAGIAESLVLLAALPAFFVVALVLPFSAIMSLFKSWQEAKTGGNEAARVTTFWMLISQMAGGVLAILVLPLLHLVGVGPPWSTAIAVLTYAFALVMPLAYGYGALNILAPPSTPQLRNATTPK